MCAGQPGEPDGPCLVLTVSCSLSFCDEHHWKYPDNVNKKLHYHSTVFVKALWCITLAKGLTTRQYGRPWVHGELVCAACGWGRCCWHEGVTSPSYNRRGHRTGHCRPWSNPTGYGWMQTPYCAWMTPIESLQPEGGRDAKKFRHYSG